MHVGDSPSKDVAGAGALGIRVVLLDRGAERPDATVFDTHAGARPDAVITSLAELPGVI